MRIRTWLERFILPGLLALAISASAADLFVPLFWARRLIIRLAILLLIAVLLVLFVRPTLLKLSAMPSAEEPRTQRILRLSLWALLMMLMIAVIAGAVIHFVQASSAQAVEAGIAAPSQLVEIAFLLVFLLLLVLTHRGAEHPLISWQLPPYAPLVFLGLCYLAAYILNVLIPMFDNPTRRFQYPELGFVPFPPSGGDFQGGLYRPALRILAGTYAPSQNLWPPLATALGLPYVLLPQSKAYVVHFVLLVLANVFCLALAAWMARQSAEAEPGSGQANPDVLCLSLFFLMLLALLPSYPFLYSLERGNIDIFAMAFAIASMYVLVRYPSRVWLPVLLLSIAAQIKIYPAVLFVILFYIKRWKIVLPAIVINIALLMVLGPVNAWRWLELLPRRLQTSYWIGNHSAVVFTRYLALELEIGQAAERLLVILFTALPIIIWLAALPALLRFKNKDQAVLAGFMISVPLMDVVPTVSYDYKTVILSCAALICLGFVLLRMRRQQGLVDYLLLLALAAVVMFIGRSNALMQEWPRYLQNKYPWSVALELLMLITIFRQVREGESKTDAAPQAELESSAAA